MTRMIIGLLLFLVLLGGGVYASTLLLQRGVSTLQEQTVELNEVQIENPVLSSFPSYTLRGSAIPEIIPNSISYYAEVAYFDDLLTLVSGVSELDVIVSILREATDDQNFIRSQGVAVVQEGDVVSIVVRIEDRDGATAFVDSLTLEEPWAVYVIGEYLLFTSSPEFAERVERSFKKRDLPLYLDTAYQETVLQLPEEGQFFTYIPDREKREKSATLESEWFNIIPDELKGAGFVMLEREGTYHIVGIQ